MLPKEEDSTIIARVKQQDKAALGLLYDKYAPAIYGVILRMCGNRELAEDLLQESFLKIWQHIGSYDASKGRFYTWAYRIAKNLTLNSLRKKDKLIQTEDLSVYKEKEGAAAPLDTTTLTGAISKLEPHHQEAISLVYFKGYTHREANVQMGVPLGTFKSYMRQALQALRKSYGKELILLLVLQLF